MLSRGLGKKITITCEKKFREIPNGSGEKKLGLIKDKKKLLKAKKFTFCSDSFSIPWFRINVSEQPFEKYNS